MNDSFLGFLTECQNRFAQSHPSLLRDMGLAHNSRSLSVDRLFEACSYTLGGGGKRIRPILCYSAAAAVNPNANADALAYAACAVEMVHAYSLIHDDLPAMDDDDLRRGRLSCHKAFDEATAILAGDALQSRAFELLTICPGLDACQKLQMVSTLTAAVGPLGMLGGQMMDIDAVGSNISLEQLQTMHSLKTGALIRASLTLGGIVSGASHKQLAAMDSYGSDIGLAFQIVDDILDVESDTATLGKTQGKDGSANKPTYVKLMGITSAKLEAKRLLSEAITALEDFGSSASYLRDLAYYIIERKN